MVYNVSGGVTLFQAGALLEPKTKSIWDKVSNQDLSIGCNLEIFVGLKYVRVFVSERPLHIY